MEKEIVRHIEIIYPPYDYVDVIIRDDESKIIFKCPVPKEIDIDKFIKNKIRELNENDS